MSIQLTKGENGVFIKNNSDSVNGMIPFSIFGYRKGITGNSVSLYRGGQLEMSNISITDLVIDGTQATPENIDNLMDSVSGGSGGSGGGVSPSEVRDIIEEYDFVPWTKSEEGRKHILLDNNWSILGKDTKGTSHNLLMLSKYDVCDFSSNTIPGTNVNTPKGERLTDQEAGETGSQAHRYAYETDIKDLAGLIYAYYLPSLPNTATFNLATKFRFRVQKMNPGFSVLLSLWDMSSDEELIYWSDGVSLNPLLVTSAGSQVLSESTNNTIAYDFVITSKEYTWNVHIGLSQGLTVMTCLIIQHDTITIDVSRSNEMVKVE